MKMLYCVTAAQFAQITEINALFEEKERELRLKMLEMEERCKRWSDFFVVELEGKIAYDERYDNVAFFYDRGDGKFSERETTFFAIRNDVAAEVTEREYALELCATAKQFFERYDEDDISGFEPNNISLGIRVEFSSDPKKLHRKPAFDDIPLIDSFVLQRIFDRVETEELAKAIFSAPLSIKNKFFCCLYEKDARSLKKMVSLLSDVPQAEIAEARKKVTAAINQLADFGILSLFPNLAYEETGEANGGEV